MKFGYEDSVRVIIADSGTATRQCVDAATTAGISINVLAHVHSLDALRTCVEPLAPDVVLCGEQLEDASPQDVCQYATELEGRWRILVVKAEGSIEEVLALIEAGASGCWFGSAQENDLAFAISEVARGRIGIPQELTGQVRNLLSVMTVQMPSDPVVRNLTRREHQILKAISLGRTNHEIAQEMNITERTTETHVRNLLHKLRARNRTEAASKFWQSGETMLGEPKLQ